ncbi:Domain of unknown function DUF1833 [uncultured Caudovirales phage]|uniref:Uncharacterized protein n=1 Tax=uncultured Caudovirales phage TaxID=2100421 RepID=A0A6J5LAL6_9CAUD|nr:Domain of unknown function DUF1833 [uncultured Caudovirales phage]
MSRAFSSNATASLHSQETGEVWLVLLTLSHADLGTPIRVVNNNEDITSRGNLFQSFPFDIVLPGQDADSPAKAVLRFDNVDRTAITAIRSLTSAPSIALEIVLASSPDTVELSFPGLTLRNVNYDASQIEGELYFEALYTEPITLTMTPSRFPGLF